MRRAHAIAIVLTILAAASQAWAITTDEVIKLKSSGINDDLIVAMMRSDGSNFDLGPAEVQRLQASGVSERVIQAMRELSAPVSAPPSSYSPLDRETRRGGGRPATATATAEPAPRLAGKAVVTVHNQDDRVKSYAWDPARRELRFFPEARKDAQGFAKGANVGLEIDPGVIALRWDGEYQHYRVSLLPGTRLDFFIEPTVANGAQAIRVALVRGGRFFAAYNLKVFYGRTVAVQRVPYGPPGAYLPASGPPPACVIVQPEPYPCESPRVSFSFGTFFGH